jgi:hypothetical protein
MSVFKDLRTQYHRNLCCDLLGYRNGFPNNADKDNPISVDLARRVLTKIPHGPCPTSPSGQTLGSRFANHTKEFLQTSFDQHLQHLRPGRWRLTTTQQTIGQFDQYKHLAELDRVIAGNPQLKTALGGDYLITPDVVVARQPVGDSIINQYGVLVDSSETIATMSPLRQGNVAGSPLVLHASISCKWTMRSDRAQNTRTEALNLIRNRKGKAPHICVVTIEPLPSRLASIAMGTGDVDCTYHATLYELLEAAKESGYLDAYELLSVLVSGHRLRDISDLPLDLAT